jgi:hypothetical protein
VWNSNDDLNFADGRTNERMDSVQNPNGDLGGPNFAGGKTSEKMDLVQNPNDDLNLVDGRTKWDPHQRSSP